MMANGVRSSAARPRGWALLVVGLILATAFISLYALRTPVPLPVDAPTNEFSAKRAIEHDYVIANEPHPAGSPANEKVPVYIRDTLKSFGVDAEIVSSLYVQEGNRAGQRDMVLAKIPGTANTKAFALMAHYDSVPYGPGASDDCSGVISMLEVARALKASPALKNDVIFVFTDGEEGSKLGSTAFANHPWFNDVGVMTNLEARGTQGNSILFGASEQNGWLIRQMIAGVRLPCATSLGYDVYKRMPFSTDFDVLRPRGMKGFDIAFVDNFAWYHTKNDTPEHLNLGTLQQHGMFALDLARQFGNVPLDGGLTAPDEMFFNALGYQIVHYPLSWGGPLALGTAVLTLLTLIIGCVRRHISIPGVLAGIAVWVICAGFAAAICVLMLVTIWGPETVRGLYTRDFTRIPDLYPLYHNTLYTIAFAVASIAVAAVVYCLACRWIRSLSLVVGAHLWWVAAMLGLVRYLPGGSYLFMWPLAFSAAGTLLFFVCAKPGTVSPVWILLQTSFALPAIALFTPSYHTFACTVMIMAAPGLAVFATAPMGLLIPQLDLLGRINRWWAPTVGAILALALLGFGLANSGFTPLRPKLDSLSYGINYDANTAYWMSADAATDEWTSQFFPPNATRADYTEFTSGRAEAVMKAPAPISPDYPSPQVTATSDTTAGGIREVTVHVASSGKAALLEMSVVSDTPVLAASVFGKSLSPADRNWRVSFKLFPREGVEVLLRVPADKQLKITVRETHYGVPVLPGFSPRPDYIACRPNTVNHHGPRLEGNRIYVTKTVEL
ncbi:MAG: M20/M25/M40 family metallo-hydrolase [Candidatus Hydrogenedentes bacterium]|nr:M20/M25/M40 family metallo-hydrolase [Candidatus Hydrogenedentota bacterium]